MTWPGAQLLRSAWRGFVALVAEEAAQDVVEYGLLIATIGAVGVVGSVALGQHLNPWIATLAGRITTAGT